MKLVKSSLLVKNVGLNCIGQIVPFICLLLTMPYVVRGLGSDRYGVFSILWTIVGYFSIFDFGLGRGTTRIVAALLGSGNTGEIPRIVLTVLLMVLGLGATAAAVFILITPYLVNSVFNVPVGLRQEMKSMFIMASPYLIMLLLQVQLRGVLEAYQRFGLINLTKIPSTVCTLIIPVIIVFFESTLFVLVLLLFIKEICFLLIYAGLCLRIMPAIDTGKLLDFRTVRPVASFAGWVSLQNIVAVVLLNNLEPFLIAMLISTTAVTSYSVPYELIMKLSVISSSIIVVLFPALSTLQILSTDRLRRTFEMALKYLMIVVLPISIVGVLFAGEIILFWLGEGFASSITVLRVIMIGFFFWSINGMFGTLLQATGHVKETAFVIVGQAPVHIVVCVILIKRFGVVGAAYAWILQRIITSILYMILSWRFNLFRSPLSAKEALKALLGLSFLIFSLLFVKSVFSFSYSAVIIGGVLLAVVYTLAVWRYFISSTEKDSLVNIVKSCVFRDAD